LNLKACLRLTYNDLDRLTAVDYGKGQKKTLEYDSWGKLIKAVSTNGDTRRTVFNKYDEFDRLVKNTETVFAKGKAQSAVKRTYAYSPYGKRTRLTVTTYGLMGGKMVKQDALKTKWEFNKFGQLVKIEKDKDVVEYLYDKHGRVLKRTANNMETYYTYTPFGQLETKSLGSPFDKSPIASLKYIYATDGSINAREVNKVKQSYKYDQLGQLTAVVNAAGGAVEKYVYDPAGNILKKDINGKITTYTYDKSNQLVSSTANGKTTNYQYDAAGRLVKEGGKSYKYGWQDKVMSITENGKVSNSYTYSMDGQIASTDIAGKTESFIWDGLALLKRGTTEYVYEPAVTGGNPILANGKGLFNDMLGNTLGVNEKDKFTSIKRDVFGKTLENQAGNQYSMFTGKPQIGGLGYAFLFRNYRPNLGKWQTADPLGYPDGFNNFAYVNNKVTNSFDWLGGTTFTAQLRVGRTPTLTSDERTPQTTYFAGDTTVTLTVNFTFTVITSWSTQTFYCSVPGCPGHTVVAGSSSGPASGTLYFSTFWEDHSATPEEIAEAVEQMNGYADTALVGIADGIRADHYQKITLEACE